MMTTTAPNATAAAGAVPHSVAPGSLPSHLQHPGLHGGAHPQTTLLLHPSTQHPLLLHPHHPHLLHTINPGLHPTLGHQHLLPASRSASLQPYYSHRGSAPGITRPTVHHPFPHRPPTPPQQPPTPPEARHPQHREVDSPLSKQSLPQTPSPPLPTPPPSANAPSERRRSEAESPSEASGGEESRLRERLGTGLVMGGRDLSSPAESDDEELSVGSESPPPPATTPLSPAPTASDSASRTPPPQPPPASPPPQPPPHRSLKFSIDNILRPEFGKKGSECEVKDAKDGGGERKSPLDLSASVSPGAPAPTQQQQQSATPPATNGPASANGAASSSSGSSTSSNSSSQPLLWPAWVYCTRYSDRPSSGEFLHVSHMIIL
ncbi:hypothetical protein J437_LFUL007774 [Ladona fulva]|uniref:Uncharacterized protein n=1 Tax=Ladona fulva TaxID=123851 RepID=A0A8K0K155_LADFU|nr:hypothetical protein J437_LFUL007774 [Ladona fulva]